ncbi:hypothetical protein CAPTEDRAFT_206379 [Capitella teleta]|uniref:Uncharacterized protein n=1 Tax=Capitella teleta TaxID=283909 RepID=R7UNA9_CAPTE|nr:hypothetical protein CAPTEDRAFT_206379 [Capitella teleta]|eukprot:ELU05437.1 hypothetical protein CAPTEDRAFT_206379 [Capitella teleta]
MKVELDDLLFVVKVTSKAEAWKKCFVQNEFHADESDEENQSEEDQSDESCKKAVKGGSHESHDTSDSDEEVESRNDKGAEFDSRVTSRIHDAWLTIEERACSGFLIGVKHMKASLMKTITESGIASDVE